MQEDPISTKPARKRKAEAAGRGGCAGRTLARAASRSRKSGRRAGSGGGAFDEWGSDDAGGGAAGGAAASEADAGDASTEMAGDVAADNVGRVRVRRRRWRVWRAAADGMRAQVCDVCGREAEEGDANVVVVCVSCDVAVHMVRH